MNEHTRVTLLEKIKLIPDVKTLNLIFQIKNLDLLRENIHL